MTSKEAAGEFLSLLQEEAATFRKRISTSSGDWIVRGFIDVFRRVFTISADTKVVSKLIELMLLPNFKDFADKHSMDLVLARHQNHYPDISFLSSDGYKFAVDLKSTYRTGSERVNTMTLGAFTGYFRERTTARTTTFPYGDYSGHFVLGVVYDRAKLKADELKIYSVEELGGVTTPINTTHTVGSLEQVPSVVENLQFFAQPKYRIANDQPGSGNTKNIGAIRQLSQLLIGNGPFAQLGEEVFDDYWTYYMTLSDARVVGLEKPPYRNLQTYFEYKSGPKPS